MLIALDPSITSCGIALFRDGRLCAATSLREPRGNTKKPAVSRCVEMSVRARDWIIEHRPPWIGQAPHFACEWPVIYPPGKGQPAPSKGIPGLSGVDTGVAALLTQYWPGLVTSCYTPREWSEGTSKKGANGKLSSWRESSRFHRAQSRMQGMVEFSIFEAQVKTHDALDAVCIGMHHLERFAPKRVIAR